MQDAQLAGQCEARDLRLEAHELRDLELKAKQEKALLQAELPGTKKELKMASLGRHPLRIKLVPLTRKY